MCQEYNGRPPPADGRLSLRIHYHAALTAIAATGSGQLLVRALTVSYCPGGTTPLLPLTWCSGVCRDESRGGRGCGHHLVWDVLCDATAH